MAKTYPRNWGTRQVSFFAGLLSCEIGFVQLKRVIDVVPRTEQNGPLYFADLLQHMEPLVSPDQWREWVEICEKIFGRVI